MTNHYKLECRKIVITSQNGDGGTSYTLPAVVSQALLGNIIDYADYLSDKDITAIGMARHLQMAVPNLVAGVAFDDIFARNAQLIKNQDVELAPSHNHRGGKRWGSFTQKLNQESVDEGAVGIRARYD